MTEEAADGNVVLQKPEETWNFHELYTRACKANCKMKRIATMQDPLLPLLILVQLGYKALFLMFHGPSCSGGGHFWSLT